MRPTIAMPLPELIVASMLGAGDRSESKSRHAIFYCARVVLEARGRRTTSQQWEHPLGNLGRASGAAIWLPLSATFKQIC